MTGSARLGIEIILLQFYVEWHWSVLYFIYTKKVSSCLDVGISLFQSRPVVRNMTDWPWEPRTRKSNAPYLCALGLGLEPKHEMVLKTLMCCEFSKTAK